MAGFRYNDKVRVINGFYEGLKGRLVEMEQDGHSQYFAHECKVLITRPHHFFTITILNHDLEKI